LIQMNRLFRRLLTLLLLPGAAIAQDSYGGQLHGNFQLDGQWYLRDEGIDPTGEFYPDERFLGRDMQISFTQTATFPEDYVMKIIRM